MRPYSHYSSTLKQAGLNDITGMTDADIDHALKYTGLGAGLGAGGGLLTALLIESFKNPGEAQYLRRALQGAGLGTLAGGGLGAAFGLNRPYLSGKGGE